MLIDSATAARLEPVHDQAVRPLFAEARTANTFSDDPVGVDIDPERLRKPSDQALTAAEIHERAYRGEYPAATALDDRAPGI